MATLPYEQYVFVIRIANGFPSGDQFKISWRYSSDGGVNWIEYARNNSIDIPQGDNVWMITPLPAFGIEKVYAGSYTSFSVLVTNLTRSYVPDKYFSLGQYMAYFGFPSGTT